MSDNLDADVADVRRCLAGGYGIAPMSARGLLTAYERLQQDLMLKDGEIAGMERIANRAYAAEAEVDRLRGKLGRAQPTDERLHRMYETANKRRSSKAWRAVLWLIKVLESERERIKDLEDQIIDAAADLAVERGRREVLETGIAELVSDPAELRGHQGWWVSVSELRGLLDVATGAHQCAHEVCSCAMGALPQCPGRQA